MSTEMKRFTVSLTPELETDLEALKKERFYNASQAEMVRYVIALGLKADKQNLASVSSQAKFQSTGA